MDQHTHIRVSLTGLLGTPVTDAHGQLRGKLKDIVVATGPDGGKVAGIVLKDAHRPLDCAFAGSHGNPCRHA